MWFGDCLQLFGYTCFCIQLSIIIVLKMCVEFFYLSVHFCLLCCVFQCFIFDQISVVIDLIDNTCLAAFSLLLCCRLLFWFEAALLRVCIVNIRVFFCVFVSFLSVLIRDEIFR